MRQFTERTRLENGPRSDQEPLESSSQARSYIRSVSSIPGWFLIEDFVVFEGINDVQCDQGVTGDLLEIGVYQGKSAILLGFFCREDEELVVCDLFDTAASTSENRNENLVQFPDLTRSPFESNYARFHERMPRVLQCPSDEIPNRGLAQSFRFVHIDGSHTYENVRTDLRTARELLLPTGIVALDDYRSPYFPGTVYAIWEEVITGGLTPICYTPHKMYATWNPSPVSDRIAAWCAQSPLLQTAERTMAGRKVLQVEARGALQLLVEQQRRKVLLEPQRPRIVAAKRIGLLILPPVLSSLLRRLRRRRRRRTRPEPEESNLT